MLYRVLVAVCSVIHTEHMNTVCGQNVELLGAFASDLKLIRVFCPSESVDPHETSHL